MAVQRNVHRHARAEQRLAGAPARQINDAQQGRSKIVAGTPYEYDSS
jgi:hypothetical protein